MTNSNQKTSKQKCTTLTVLQAANYTINVKTLPRDFGWSEAKRKILWLNSNSQYLILIWEKEMERKMRNVSRRPAKFICRCFFSSTVSIQDKEINLFFKRYVVIKEGPNICTVALLPWNKKVVDSWGVSEFGCSPHAWDVSRYSDLMWGGFD